jgi:ankyrin repeat protein
MARNELIQQLVEDDTQSEFPLYNLAFLLAINAVELIQLEASPTCYLIWQRQCSSCTAQSGADPNVSDSQGCRPLHYAAASSRLDVMDLLLGHYADPNALTNVNFK